MGEWKRVFCDPKRAGLILLFVLLNSGLFLFGLMDRVGKGEVQRVLETGKYVSQLVKKWEGKAPEELVGPAAEEAKRIRDYESYYSDWTYEDLPYDTDEAADESMTDLPYIVEGKELGGDEFWFRAGAFYDAVTKKQEEIDYLAGYHDYLEKIRKQAEEQSKTSVFGKANSFSARNLKKTAAAFLPLTEVEVSFGNNTGIEKWLGYRLGDLFGLLAVIVFVNAFLEERKKGLWNIVRTLRDGRRYLGIMRVLILTAACFLFTLLFNLLNLYLSVQIYGGNMGLSRPIQSVESFRTCTLRISIGQWILLYTLFKSFSSLLTGLVIWYLMGSVANAQLSLSVLIVFLAAEYSLFTFLPVQSAFNLFKYLNLFSYVHTAKLYTDYLNINIFGFPVNNREMAVILLPVLTGGFAFLCVRMQEKRYPEGSRDLLSGIALKLDTLLDKLRFRLSAFGFEVYKALVYEYGIVILILCVIAGRNLRFRVYQPLDEAERMYRMLLSDAEGEIDAEMDAYMEKVRYNAENEASSGDLLPAVERLEEEVAGLKKRAEEKGYAPYLSEPSPYIEYYGSVAKDRQRLNALVAVLFAVFLCGGMMSYERQSGVVPLVRTLEGGRRGMLGRKLLLTAVLTLCAFLAVYLREILEFVGCVDTGSLSADVRNLDALRDFPVRLSIRGYVILLYLLRFVMLYLTAMIVLFISSRTPNVRISYIAASAVLCFPGLLTILGAEVFRYVSPVVPVSQAELLWGLGSGKLLYLLPGTVYAAVGAGAAVRIKREWEGDRGKRHRRSEFHL